MKVISYNVNGIRAAMTKNLGGWLVDHKPDVLALQEIKANPEQFENYLFEVAGYKTFWYPAQKKGYSGVALLTKVQPDAVFYGIGHPDIDFEGRVIRADIGDTSFISVYAPSGTTGEVRQGFKMSFLEVFEAYLKDLMLTRPKLIVCGDINICHQAIDIHDPKGNAGSSGFLPEERAWMETMLCDSGPFTDAYRHLNPTSVAYSWWSFRAGARSRNKGWRIDYTLVSKPLVASLTNAYALPDSLHSDHCPVVVELDI